MTQARIQLDRTKLLGFRLDATIRPEASTASGKMGAKFGTKIGGKIGNKAGQKPVRSV